MDPARLSGAADVFDIAIVGGGPAGLSAAVAGGRMNRRTVCFETGTPRTAHAPRYYNYLGFPDGVSGREMLELGRKQARRWGSQLWDVPVTALERVDEGKEVGIARAGTAGRDGGREAGRDGGIEAAGPTPPAAPFRLETPAGLVHARGVIFATGIEDRHPRCGSLYGERGIHYCVVCDGYETRGERVAVVGHGAGALEMVEALRDFTADLHLLLDGHPAELDEEGLHALEAWGVRVEQPELERHHCSPRGVFFDTAEGEELFFPHVFVALGVEPNTDLARQLGCHLDGSGFIVTDERQRTSLPFVYAAGDCDGGHKQVTQAMAEGELAAIELAKLLRETVGETLISAPNAEAPGSAPNAARPLKTQPPRSDTPAAGSDSRGRC